MCMSHRKLIFQQLFFFFFSFLNKKQWFCGRRIEKKLYCVDNRSGNKWLSDGSDCVPSFLCACVLLTGSVGDKTARVALFTVKCVLHRRTCSDSEGSELWPGGADVVSQPVINQSILSNREKLTPCWFVFCIFSVTVSQFHMHID